MLENQRYHCIGLWLSSKYCCQTRISSLYKTWQMFLRQKGERVQLWGIIRVLVPSKIVRGAFPLFINTNTISVLFGEFPFEMRLFHLIAQSISIFQLIFLPLLSLINLKIPCLISYDSSTRYWNFFMISSCFYISLCASSRF